MSLLLSVLMITPTPPVAPYVPLGGWGGGVCVCACVCVSKSSKELLCEKIKTSKQTQKRTSCARLSSHHGWFKLLLFPQLSFEHQRTGQATLQVAINVLFCLFFFLDWGAWYGDGWNVAHYYEVKLLMVHKWTKPLLDLCTYIALIRRDSWFT